MSVVWLTGLSGAGKTTIAEALLQHVDGQMVDGDVIRRTMSSDLRQGPVDRKENYRRVVNFIKTILAPSQFVIAAFVSPEKTEREWIKGQFEKDQVPFYEVFVATPLGTCEDRDVKGLYARFRRGEDVSLAGLTEDYQQPQDPAAVCYTDTETLQQCVDKILEVIKPPRDDTNDGINPI